MDLEQIKKTVQNAFSDVDSEEFLQIKLKNQVDAHKLNYEKYRKRNPDKDFFSWRKQAEEEINTKTNNNSEILAIGIYLLALDELKPDD